MGEIEDIEKKYGKPKYDSVKLGAILGILAPMVGFFGYYLVLHRNMTLSSFFSYLKLGEIFLPVISLCIYASNLLLFFAFIWTKKDKSARGVLMATILYTIYVAIMKIT